MSSEHVELDNRYQSLVVDRDNQSRAFSALQFELNGLKVALSERDARIASLRAVTTTATSKDQSLNIVKSENDQSENDKSQHEKSEINQAQQEKALLELRTERDRIVSGLRADHEEALAKYRRRAEAAETELQTARGQTNGLQTDMAKLRAEHISVTDRLKAFTDERDSLLLRSKDHERQLQGFTTTASVKDSELAGASLELGNLREEFAAQAKRVDAATREAAALRVELTASKAEAKALGDVSASHELAVADNEKNVLNLKNELVGLRNALDESRGETDRLRQEQKTFAGDRSAVQAELDRLRATLAESTSEVERVRGEHGDLVGQHEGLLGDHAGARSELDRLRAQLAELRSESDTIRGDHETLLGNHQSLLGERDGANGELDRLRGELQRVHSESEGLRSERDKLAGEGESARTRYDQLRLELEGARNDLGRFGADTEGLRQQVSNLQGELHKSGELTGTLRSEVEGLYRDRDGQHGEIERLRNELSNRDNELGGVRGQFETADAGVRGLRLEIDQLKAAHTNEISSLHGELERTKSDHANASAVELESLREQLGDAYGELDVTKSQHLEQRTALQADHERSLQQRSNALVEEHARALASSDARHQHLEEELRTLRGIHERLRGELSVSEAQIGSAGASGFVAARGADGSVAETSNGNQGEDGRAAIGQARDDLQRIEGIGPRIEQALLSSGITTFRDVSRASEQRLRAALEAAGLSFAPSLTTWAEQATLLARGDEEGFAKLTARLIAGKGK